MKKLSGQIAPALFAVGLIIFNAGISMSQTTSVLKEMSLQKGGARLNFLFKVEGAYVVEASFLPSPPRLIVDMTPISEMQILPVTQIGDMGVLDVRAVQSGPDKIQIIFDFGPMIPAYGITQGAEGLKISFWNEGEIAAISDPRPAEAAKPIVSTAPAAPVAPVQARSAALERSGFFIAGRAGLSLFVGEDLSVEKTFDLYGETATLAESYSFRTVPAFELQFGRYFNRTKIGIGIGYYSPLKNPGSFTAGLPHPFLPETPRNVSFESDGGKNTLWDFSVFALFSFLNTETLSVAAGPMIGLSLGAMQSMEDFDFTEESPYDAAHVTVANMTYAKDQFTELSFGMLLSLEYRLNEGLGLLFDLRGVYLNPKNVTLGKRANLLHLQPVLGIQYSF